MPKHKPDYHKAFWKNLPPASYAIILAAIFFTFSSIGFIVDILNAGRLPPGILLGNVLFAGLTAIGYVHSFTRNLKIFPLVLLFQVGFTIFLSQPDGTMPAEPALKSRLTLDGLGIMFSIILGYAFFIIFISREGRKQIVLRTEMNLAREMHEVLAPAIHFREDKRFEIYGRTLPAEEVGGDLLDVYRAGNLLTAYIADVSGHGVAAGLLMGMFKSAMHAHLQQNLPLPEILNRANRSLYRLKKKTMFLTCACIRFNESQTAEFALAGHLPILHYRAESGSLERLRISQIPLSVKPDYEFSSGEAAYSPGDWFALLTDGLIETVDAKDREFGLERLEKLLLESRALPPPQLFETALAEINRHGPQTDDQTFLVIRCL